jgi:uncharacterized protein (TIGR02453 family)
MGFDGFPTETITFLTQLEKNNNREWFEDHRPDYEQFVMEPSRSFVVEMGKRLADFDSEILAEPKVNGSIRRINRDTRFSPDKTRYKNHLDFFFGHQSFRGRPLYGVRFDRQTLGLGAGQNGFEEATLTRYRKRVADDNTGSELAVNLKKLQKAGFESSGQHWKRVPKGYDENHPRAELLKHNGLFVGAEMPIPAEFHTKAFPTLVMRHFRRFRPVVDWLIKTQP